jgi:hypothetical protein
MPAIHTRHDACCNMFVGMNDCVVICMLLLLFRPDENGLPVSEFQHKDTISVEQSIAAQFKLKNYGDVVVNKMDAASVCCV